MALITNGQTLSNLLIKCIEKHNTITFATAWASANTDVINTLYENKSKIKKSAIGTHFYQTHPDVLEIFIDFNQVHFVLQPSGVFHPKAYLFQSKDSWDIILGSANMTHGAFTRNQEMTLHLSSRKNDNFDNLVSDIKKTIHAMWSSGEKMTSKKFENYKSMHNIQKSKIQSISGTYGEEKVKKSPLDSSVLNYSWDKYVHKVKIDEHHGVKDRCEILAEAQEQFATSTFSKMSLEWRKAIAGLDNDFNGKDFKWFGSMSGAGKFANRIINNNENISKALDKIPLVGAVTSQNYFDYIDSFLEAFPNDRDGLAGVTRLLALKRPDYFVCLNQRNSQQLCKNFGISNIYGTDDKYKHYWERVIERILDSRWWNAPCPKNVLEKKIWDGRVAMLDAIFYTPKE